jgi:hypothetical protein
VLIGSGRAHPAQRAADVEAAAPASERLNKHLISRSRISGDVGWLASPVIGAGVAVGRFEQMFLDARTRGKATAAEWADDAWASLSQQGQSIIKDGEPLKTPEENLEELLRQAKALAETRLPLLRRLKVVA